MARLVYKVSDIKSIFESHKIGKIKPAPRIVKYQIFEIHFHYLETADCWKFFIVNNDKFYFTDTVVKYLDGLQASREIIDILLMPNHISE